MNLPYTILVAENDHDTRVVYREALEEAGYRVITAADGHSALDVLRVVTIEATELHRKPGVEDAEDGHAANPGSAYYGSSQGSALTTPGMSPYAYGGGAPVGIGAQTNTTTLLLVGGLALVLLFAFKK